MIKYTPMLEQYLDIKKEYTDCLLFFRLGDFYELFFEDAISASSILNITLTKKSAGKDNAGNPQKIDMCGVPFHSAESYITKLVANGYKVAICEQLEDPKQAKKIVDRDVVRVVTPGTVLDTNILDETKNNYISCIFEDKLGFGLSFADVSTGEFLTNSFKIDDFNKVIDELARYNPSEIICNEKILTYSQLEEIFDIKPSNYQKFAFDLKNAKETLCKHFKTINLAGFGIEDDSLCISSAGALLSYLIDTQKNKLDHLSSIKKQQDKKYMALDISSRKNLELTETIREKAKKGSLLWVLDKTKTPMGARLIRKWLEQPLIDEDEINERLESVELMKEKVLLREDIKDVLKLVLDIERICSKMIYMTANARDLVSLKKSFEILPNLKKHISFLDTKIFKNLYENFDELEDLRNLIHSSICEEPPFSIRDGGIIKDGYNAEIDKYRQAKTEGSKWLVELENREREKTGIKNLKVRFNKVFGYYIEITNSNLGLVPNHFIRRQTLSNCERFITDELKTVEETILGADEKAVLLEHSLFCEIRDEIANNILRIQKASQKIALIDVLQSLAQVAQSNNYCKPSVMQNEKKELEIISGRHPVVELISKESFIHNCTYLNKNENRLNIITGPNMSGKSTYMRQVALITLMAQIGSFVPAEAAKISIVDRIFTRVGASDDLATGQSTFMIEMNEVANIINNATDNSLLILDEIGRGTSTFDGLSIAWAVLEYIANTLGSRSLFATHYHEITSIEGKVFGIKNYCVEVKESGNEIIFLRNITIGVAKESYGIHVAKLAGIPFSIISRANEILDFLRSSEMPSATDAEMRADKNSTGNFYYNQTSNKTILFVDELEKTLRKLDINNISPMEAWNKLLDIKQKLSLLD